MAMARRNNQMLDLFKCIAVYGILFSHVPVPGEAGWAWCALSKFGVPLFFLTAGFFTWEAGPEVLRRRTAKTALRLLAVTAALVVLGCAMAVHQGQTVQAYLRGRMDPFFLKEILLYQLLPLPCSWPMWYLAAQLALYLLWWAMTWAARRLGRRLPYNALALLGVGLLLVHLSLAEWRVLGGGAALESKFVRNAWLHGFPFFALGAWMGEHRGAVRRLPPAPLWAGLPLAMGLAYWEYARAGVMDVFMGTSLTALLLMAIALARPEVPSPLLRRTACFCGARLTFPIYILHVPLYGIVQEWQGDWAPFAWLMAHPVVKPLAIAAASTALALAAWALGRAGKHITRSDRT